MQPDFQIVKFYAHFYRGINDYTKFSSGFLSDFYQTFKVFFQNF
jgi:hypothetical protein